MEILIHCHEPTAEENLRYLGISPDSKKFKIMSFKTQREYALGFNDTYNSELILDVPEGWDHPKIRRGNWEAEKYPEYRTLQSFRDSGFKLMPTSAGYSRGERER